MFVSRVLVAVALACLLACTPTTPMDVGVAEAGADDTPTDVAATLDVPPGCEDVSGGFVWTIDHPSFTAVFGLPTTECLTRPAAP